MTAHLPVIYIRPTIDKRIALWAGAQNDPDPRPTDSAHYFVTIEEAEAALPDVMEQVGDIFAVVIVYVDQYNEKQKAGK